MTIMMIGDENGSAYPHFICDQCHKPIVDIRFGLVVWFANITQPGEVAHGYVVHKRECDRNLQLGMAGDDRGQCTELSEFARMTFDHPSRRCRGNNPLQRFPGGLEDI